MTERQFVTAGLGAMLPRRVPGGEIATVCGTDISQTSWALTMVGPGVGAVLAYVTAGIVLQSVDPLLATVVLLGVPAVVLVVGPLLNRLQKVDTGYRSELGALTTRAGDLVSELRVLAGVGGRDLFARRYAERSQRLLQQGYRVGDIMSWVMALTVGIPALFLAAVVWLSARMAAEGQITVGELVAVYGYVAVLAMPVWFLLEGGFMTVQGMVSARRIIAVLRLRPEDSAVVDAQRPKTVVRWPATLATPADLGNKSPIRLRQHDTALTFEHDDRIPPQRRVELMPGIQVTKTIKVVCIGSGHRRITSDLCSDGRVPGGAPEVVSRKP